MKEDNTVQDDIFSEQVMLEGEKLDPDSETMTHSSMSKVIKRKHGQATLIERQVWFKGHVYIIEEELFSESDKSSVYSSEDSW